MTLLVRGGTVFHGDPPQRLEGDVVVEEGRIAGVPSNTFEKVRIVDATGCLVIPGLVIAHHHLYSALARGMPGPSVAPERFVEVLEAIWWRLDRALDGDLNETSALVGTVEALRAGVTGIIDHHASPDAIEGSLDRIACGVRRAGGRAVLCYEATDRHGEAGFEAGLAENDRFAGCTSGEIGAMVGGHAPFTLSDDHLRRLAELARRHEVALHIHVAEDAHDQADARARGAENVTERLERAGVLAGRAVLAHGVHLSNAEIERLREAPEVWLTHQPRSNMNNHVGYCAAGPAMGSRLALGTDGINGDLLAEAQAAFFRLREQDGAAVAETVWSWLAGGWRALSSAFGLDPRTGFGWLVPGAPADLVVLEYDSPTPVHEGNLAWHLVFGVGARHVRDVVVGGELVVEGRRSTRVEAAELGREAHAAAERLWARMAESARRGGRGKKAP